MSFHTRIALGTIAAASVLVLSGCGTTTNVAATFDDHVVTEAEVSAAVTEINEAFSPQRPFTGQQALTSLIRAPYFLEYARTHGFPQTESAARAIIPIHDPSPSTVRILQAEAVISHLDQAATIELTEFFKDLEVEVNPKYGAYDGAAAGIGPANPDWLEPAGR